ncbi:MAG: repressor LexA [Clostridia bacterium]|nr:repressor LexA [Clostridia bacterium]
MKVLDKNKLTQVLSFINTYQAMNGKSPTCRVIMKELKFSNTGIVYRYVKRLEETGAIEKTEHGGISIPTNLMLSGTTKAPLVGDIACGDPILAIENIEAVVDLPVAIFGKGNFRLYHAKGDSMIDIGIYDGDLIVAKPSDTADEGDVVIAIVEDSATVKRYYKRNNKVVLHPENKDYKDIIVDNCIIQGIVKKVIHNI